MLSSYEEEYMYKERRGKISSVRKEKFLLRTNNVAKCGMMLDPRTVDSTDSNEQLKH